MLNSPEAITSPFFQMVPQFAMIPLILLSVMATIIASQAIITGLFSVSSQAIMLGYLPKMQICYTSSEQRGQIYVPAINYILYFFTVFNTLIFRSTNNMVTMYGLSVVLIMAITTILILYMAIHQWRWPKITLILVFIPLVGIDILLVTASLFKLMNGAFYILLVSSIVCYFIWLWTKGNKDIDKHLARYLAGEGNLEECIKKHGKPKFPRIPGSAIFLTESNDYIPYSLSLHLKHFKFLHQKVFFISIFTSERPRVPQVDRFFVEEINSNVYRLIVKYGFREIPDFNRIIKWLEDSKFINDTRDLSILLSKVSPIVSSSATTFNAVNKLLYKFVYKNVSFTYDFYKIPPINSLELGEKLKL